MGPKHQQQASERGINYFELSIDGMDARLQVQPVQTFSESSAEECVEIRFSSGAFCSALQLKPEEVSDLQEILEAATTD
jgi:hypothetical protein